MARPCSGGHHRRRAYPLPPTTPGICSPVTSTAGPGGAREKRGEALERGVSANSPTWSRPYVRSTRSQVSALATVPTQQTWEDHDRVVRPNTQSHADHIEPHQHTRDRPEARDVVSQPRGRGEVWLTSPHRTSPLATVRTRRKPFRHNPYAPAAHFRLPARSGEATGGPDPTRHKVNTCSFHASSDPVRASPPIHPRGSDVVTTQASSDNSPL